MDPGTILAGVQLCARSIGFIAQTCENYRAANAEMAERIAIVENTWIRTRIQVEFIELLGPIHDAEHHRVLENILGVLAARLSSAVRKLDGVLPKQENGAGGEPSPGWFRFSRGVRVRLRQGLARRDHPRRGGMVVETAPSSLSLTNGLRTALRPDGPHHSVFLPRTDLDFLPIPYCNAKAVCRRGSSDRWFLANRLTCRPTVDVNAMTRDIRTLAKKLTHADPLTFNLFQYKGVMRITDPSRPSHIRAFDLVFFIPDGMKIPHNLHGGPYQDEAFADYGREVLSRCALVSDQPRRGQRSFWQ
ncbi:hypothetical protein B0J13DRAFT_656877 [Dactylonectria estremocensis]|uniref:Uncharacterized protein n=1 Tax=Dactylonectria estremocensis TaxID=1079267 RepID=A0A9P9D736_9HYPO|nr:hypothetical protein B0J13DRAFT_656877 [Dactylonectria estremocensis]